MSTTRRILMLAHIPVLVIWIVLAWTAFDSLPERIPTHFNATGIPDGFMERSVFSWFLLPLIAGVSALLIWFSSHFTNTNPERWNVPNKKAFLALSPEQRQPLVEMLNTLLAAVSLFTVVFLGALHYDTWRVATGRMSGLTFASFGALALLLTISLGGAFVFMLRFNSKLRELSGRG